MSDIKTRPAREERRVLGLERVGHVVALEEQVRVEEERRDVGAAAGVRRSAGRWCRFRIPDQPPPAASSSTKAPFLA